ncbi:MAG: DNA primase small subunit domain-containing protein [archaeon]
MEKEIKKPLENKNQYNGESPTKKLPEKKEYQKEDLTKAQVLALSYYARKDVQQAMLEFCKNRETIANFNNKFFAKRPDCFDYPGDIFLSAKKGATSFHCSEELWENPLDIKTDMTPKQYNEIKIGWDLLIDIDSKYMDYSKIAAKLLIQALEHHGIKNYGIKFSGSKGFHILVPFKAFPEIYAEEMTKDHFPEWARFIAGYIFEIIKEPMNNEILKLSNREELEKKGELISEHICPKCKNPTIKKFVGKYVCQDKVKCKGELESMKSNRKEMICSSCYGKMDRVSQREINFCENCKINTANIEASSSSYGGIKRPGAEEFKIEETTKSTEDSVDIVLVSSRHLFRAPYSLHEKTAFASIVLEKDEIENFKPTDADTLKIKKFKSFMPNSVPGEAKELLVQAIDWGTKKEPETKKYTGESIDIEGLEISEDMFPPVIKKILDGIKDDGRKRALSLLLSFFTTLKFPQDFIEEKITEWNKKNYHPLKDGYIKSQIAWYIKNPRLPQNYDKPIYKEFGIRGPPEPGMKNPITYTIKMAMRARRKIDNKAKREN